MIALVLRNMVRNRARFAFTAGAVVAAFLLLGLLLPLQRLFESRVDFANASRLMVINKTSMMRPLPISYEERIAQVPNVKETSYFTFFGAMFQSPANPVAAVVTQPEKFAAMVEEVQFRDPAGLQDWIGDPASVAIGRQLAERLHWRVGDLVPVFSRIHPRLDGSYTWTFRVATIFDARDASGKTDSMIINHRYFDQERAAGRHTVGWYAVRVSDARQAAATGAAIDRIFANSPDETSSTTERAFAQSFLQQIGDFRLMITIALTLVFWTLILITGNTMAQAIAERDAEVAVMKTLGFTGARIVRIILAESLLMLGCGGIAGLALAAAIVPVVASQTTELLSALETTWTDCLLAVALIAGIGLAVGLMPAMRAARKDIISGLAAAT